MSHTGKYHRFQLQNPGLKKDTHKVCRQIVAAGAEKEKEQETADPKRNSISICSMMTQERWNKTDDSPMTKRI
jgi:hypothetical protein